MGTPTYSQSARRVGGLGDLQLLSEVEVLWRNLLRNVGNLAGVGELMSKQYF